VLALAAVVVASLVSPAPAVRLTTAHPIAAFAAAGGKIAYLDSGDCHVRLGASVIGLSDDASCLGDTLALADGQVGWGGFREVKCSDDYWIVAAGPPGMVLEHHSYGCDQGGSTLPTIAGAGSDLYYAFFDYQESNDCVNTGGSCVFTSAAGTLVRLSHGRKTTLRSVPPAALLAAAPGRIAIVGAAKRYVHPVLKPKPPGAYPLPATGPLELRDGATGRLLQSIRLPSEAEALAVTPSIVAVVVISDKKRTLRWYGASDGSFGLGKVDVVALATEDKTIVVETARMIRAIDIASGKETASWKVGGTPAGLSIDGSHVLWAENSNGHGRILDARLP
jgi:hypothetical protein